MILAWILMFDSDFCEISEFCITYVEFVNGDHLLLKNWVCACSLIKNDWRLFKILKCCNQLWHSYSWSHRHAKLVSAVDVRLKIKHHGPVKKKKKKKKISHWNVRCKHTRSYLTYTVAIAHTFAISIYKAWIPLNHSVASNKINRHTHITSEKPS